MPDMMIVKTERLNVKPSDIPSHVADGFARATLRAVERYFSDPAVKVEYEKWLEKRQNDILCEVNEEENHENIY